MQRTHSACPLHPCLLQIFPVKSVYSSGLDVVHQASNKELARARDEAESRAQEVNTRCSLLEAQLRDSQEERGVLSEQVRATLTLHLTVCTAYKGE